MRGTIHFFPVHLLLFLSLIYYWTWQRPKRSVPNKARYESTLTTPSGGCKRETKPSGWPSTANTSGKKQDETKIRAKLRMSEWMYCTFFVLAFFSKVSDSGFFLGCSVALEKRSSNSLVLMMFGSSREPHSVLLLGKQVKALVCARFDHILTHTVTGCKRFDHSPDGRLVSPRAASKHRGYLS